MNYRVLSIQSHVVFGYVGNKAAVFPLQALGFEVDPINSVQFSNHTGYKFCNGQVLNSSDLDVLVDNLQKNNLDNNYTHLLTGYINSTSFLRRIAQLCRDLKQKNPNLIYVCDPVMGDNGKMYVNKDILPIFRNEIISIADIITPNQFELEILTGTKIESINDAWNAINTLHETGCKTIVVSSTDLGNDQKLISLASSINNNRNTRYLIEIPKFQSTFTGTGDVFAALFLAWFTKTNGNVRQTLEQTVATLQAILKQTLSCYANGETNATDSPANIELKLIQSLDDIRNPVVSIPAQIIQE